MKSSRSSLVALTAVALALGGAASAFAAFDVAAPGAVMRFKTIKMPSFDSAPAVEQQVAKVKLAWVAQKIGGGVHVERYLVTRYSVPTGPGVQVCGNAVTVAKCTDVNVPAGRWKYTVRTVQGTWMGPESKRSDVVKIEAADAAVAPSLVADEAPADAAAGPGAVAATTKPTTDSPSSPAAVDTKSPEATQTTETKDPVVPAEPEETVPAPVPPPVEPQPSEPSKAAADDEAADK